MYVKKLVCSRCGKEYRPEDNPLLCERRDLGRLDIIYDYRAISGKVTRATLESRKLRDVWRYEELLPVSSKFAVKLGEGGTPLIHARRLGEKLAMGNLFLKDETRNPTASFKDRAMAVGLAKAIELRKEDVVIASSGNAAASLAAYSAAAGIRCHAFVPHDASKGKVAQLLMYGAAIVRCKQVKEGEDSTVQSMIEAADRFGYYPCPSFGPFNPYQVEGPKTIVYELYEQRGWANIDIILVPTGSGCLLTGIWKGLEDFKRLGLIESLPRLVAVQPEGNSALVKAIEGGLGFGQIVLEAYPKSIASGLLDPYPWDGDAAMAAVKSTNGAGVFVSDEEIMQAMKDLAAYEGVFAEASGAAGLAGLKKMMTDRVVEKNGNVVVLVTGSGLKEPDRIIEMHPEPLLV
ncbi:MAG: threonine synthase [Nitrososphaerales archaeon]|nr:threonine synthase [Nitrososphaerales archaeon]